MAFFSCLFFGFEAFLMGACLSVNSCKVKIKLFVFVFTSSVLVMSQKSVWDISFFKHILIKV